MGQPYRLIRLGKRVGLTLSPEDESRIRTRSYLRTMSKLNTLDDDPEDVEIALDTCVEVDTIYIEFARQRRLKPYIKEYLRL